MRVLLRLDQRTVRVGPGTLSSIIDCLKTEYGPLLTNHRQSCSVFGAEQNYF